MNGITDIELFLMLNTIGLLIGLASFVILFSIFRRTKDEIKTSFLILMIGVLVFCLYELFRLYEIFSGEIFFSDLITVFFILFVLFSVFKLKSLIKSLSDFGQAFVILKNDTYEHKIGSIVKDARGVCYVTVETPNDKLKTIFEKENIDVSNLKFLDATGEKCVLDNCVNIKNDPEDIKNSIKRMLREKNIKCVIVDNVSAIKNLERFEIPLFIQETASLIKSSEAQGFFIGYMEKIDKQMINDINMLVDKVIGD
jgi:hypothetical protein